MWWSQSLTPSSTGEKTKKQRSEGLAQGHMASQWWVWNWKQGSQTPFPAEAPVPTCLGEKPLMMFLARYPDAPGLTFLSLYPDSSEDCAQHMVSSPSSNYAQRSKTKAWAGETQTHEFSFGNHSWGLWWSPLLGIFEGLLCSCDLTKRR